MRAASLQTRYLSLWLPRLATDRLMRAHGAPFENEPLALVGDLRNARVLLDMNLEASRLGLRMGQMLTDARAMYPSLQIRDADEAGDARFLEEIADWCERYTPLIGFDRPHGLLFDITGCAHLFGDEQALATDLIARLLRQGLRARIGIASTVGCAWGVAHYGPARQAVISVRPGEERGTLLALPLEALRLEPRVLDALHSIGFKAIGDVEANARAPMTARFGKAFMRRLDQARGLEAEPINPIRPAPDFMTERRFAEPVLLETHILDSVGQLALEMNALLERHARGARRIEIALFHVDGKVKRIVLGLSRASRDPALIQKLFVDRLGVLGDESDPGFGFDMLRLSALVTERIEALQSGFAQVDHQKEMARLIDRFGARFGPRRVLRWKPGNTHIPEHAAIAVPVFQCASDGGKDWQDGAMERLAQDSDMPSRPIRLLGRPEPIEAMAEVPDGPPVRFRWRRLMHEVTRVEGPERIAMEWWRDAQGEALTRDYFRIENKEGLRLWLYREGLYERETTRPRWFVHGLFA